MARKPVPGGPIWVCVDCLFAHCGWTEEELGYKPDTEPWALWADGSAQGVTMGGACDWETCEERNTRGECECDSMDFSWSPCDGCGSHLGGTRHAFTYWITVEETESA